MNFINKLRHMKMLVVNDDDRWVLDPEFTKIISNGMLDDYQLTWMSKTLSLISTYILHYGEDREKGWKERLFSLKVENVNQILKRNFDLDLLAYADSSEERATFIRDILYSDENTTIRAACEEVMNKERLEIIGLAIGFTDGYLTTITYDSPYLKTVEEIINNINSIINTVPKQTSLYLRLESSLREFKYEKEYLEGK